jgi:hypothetical protein
MNLCFVTLVQCHHSVNHGSYNSQTALKTSHAASPQHISSCKQIPQRYLLIMRPGVASLCSTARATRDVRSISNLKRWNAPTSK